MASIKTNGSLSNGSLSTKTTASNPNGKRLLPHIIDEFARQEPQREWGQVPVSSDPKDGWKTVTYQQLANAINRCCHMIIQQVGQATPGQFPTIAYIGPNDARYPIMTVAGMKTGYQILLISPRNSKEAQLNLFNQTDCHFIAFPESYNTMVQPLLDERDDMKAIKVASLDEWLDEKPVPHYPFDKTFEEARWEPMCVLHTSGSTGLPKPIIIKQGNFALTDAWKDAPEWEGREIIWQKYIRGSKRHFTTSGLYLSFMIAVYYGKPIALGIADRPISSDLIMETLAHLDVQTVILPPAILEDMSLNDQAVKRLKKLNAIGFGGGNMAPEAGERLSKAGVRLVNLIAATECLVFPLYWNEDPKLWQWFIYNPNMCGIAWRKREAEGDNVYELVFERKDKDPATYWQGYFYTFPEENVVSTKDLYTRHPTLPNHWLYYGRADDIIVFSNGEKLNPVTIEGIVTDHPQVKSSLVVGYMRFQAALIIEPVTQPASDEERQALIESVWTKVQQANEVTVAHGQIDRSLIMVASPDKPFSRAGKGTVQRAATVRLYKDEINQLYEKVDQAARANAPRFDVSSEDALADSIAEMFRSHVGAATLEPDTDFFSAGIDSMQVIKASRLLRAGLAAAQTSNIDPGALSTRAVYANPSPRGLARYIMQTIARGEDVTKGTNGAHEDIDPQAQQQHDMKALHDKYTENLLRQPAAAAASPRPEAADADQTVLLTGSTGMLGTYMLDAMAHNPRVRKIICLNRPDDGGATKQAAAMRERGLDGGYGGGKAEFYHIDASRPHLGLSEEVYARLLREADRVVLNAWPVNFNMPVGSFEPHIRGVRHWADFAAAAAKRVAVVFVSSVGTVGRWPQGNGLVPEARLEDMSLAHGGYGASKMVASLVLEDAARAGDFPAAAIRVGQIAGPERDAGVWNRQEWFPSLVASSLYLGALPADLGSMDRMDWTPVERIASLVLEVGGVTQSVDPSTISGYFHGVNPSTTTWSTLSQAVREFYGPERLPETVSFLEWVRRLEKTQGEGTGTLDRNPGVKLLDTYRQMAASQLAPGVLDMTRTVAQSPTMRGSEAVTPELMKQWCKHWGF